MRHIFIDSNIFLHYQDFEKIDWLTESSSKQCKLVIAPIVMDELDKKKIGTNKISNKARKALNRFEELSEIDNSEISKNVFVEILLDKPPKSVYEKYDLNFEEQDHRLIASIIFYRETRKIQDIELCTNDIGPRLRVKQFGIRALKLNTKYLLPSQESEEEKKLKKLEHENRSLQLRIPKIHLEFENKKEFIELHVDAKRKLDLGDFCSKRMSEIKAKYPLLSLEHENPYDKPISLLHKSFAFLPPSPEQINTYNKELKEFYREYENCLNKIFKYNKRKSLTFGIKIFLSNTGNIPAEDIDIHLHFPDGFDLVESTEIAAPLEFPKPPYKPKTRFDIGFSAMVNNPYLHSFESKVNLNTNRPNIKKTNSYTDVDYYRESLKHGYRESLEELSVIFGESNDIKNFQVDYKLSAANIPEPINGKLNVIFKNNSSLPQV